MKEEMKTDEKKFNNLKGGKVMNLSLVFCIPGMPFDGDSLQNQSLGGSETAGLSMAKEMAKKGHMVKMFCNTSKLSRDKEGVEYYPLQFFKTFASTTPHDVCIVQRAPEMFARRIESKLNVLWVHDLPLLRQAKTFKAALWNVDKVMTVSSYHTERIKKVYKLPDSIFMTSRNGIDSSLIPVIKEKGLRNFNQLVYAARPERGLDNLLETILPKLIKRNPNIKLMVCGYDNTTDAMREFYDYLKGLIAKYPKNAVWLGHLTKPELYKLYSESGAYVYPTPSKRAEGFREVSCISAMEAQMCGLPIITSNRGALGETIPNAKEGENKEAGILIEGDPWTEEYQDEFVEEVLSISMGDHERWKKMAINGMNHASTLSWEGLAEDWTTKFLSFIKERNDSKTRLANHLLRRSDVIVAEKLAEELGDEGLKTEINQGWAFIKDKETTREQYEKIGQTHTDVFAQTSGEPRFKMLVNKFKEHPEIKSVLDFGCAHGSYAIHLSNQFPELIIQGVDVDKYSVEWANKHKENHAEHKDHLNFMVGDADIDLSGHELYDALIAFEVLEHTDKPWEVIEKLERWVKPGGKIFITTPYGPWEEDSYHTYPHRCHVWELGFDELREMFKDKKNVVIESQYCGSSTVQGIPLGFNFTTYTKSEATTEEINVERKMSLQRPRQTVSLSMICGPGAEKTLEWALDSVKTIADEIIIADCGMSNEAVKIALKYHAKIIEGKNPREFGFDEARNVTLPHCTKDWILWLDSDERIMDGKNIHKYLRENMYHGYSIKQHHFAVDTSFNPDLPVRLFRNRPYEGKTLKFFGSCHEHPEIGLNEGTGPVIVLSDVNIAHVGYLAESGRKQRFFRNYPLMQMSIRKYPDRLLNKYFQMRDSMILNNYELGANGGKPSQAITERCQEVIDLYREFFCGKGSYMNTDAIEFYSQACRMLGIGAEVAFAVNSAQEKVPQPEVKVYRFADEKDLQAELALKAKEAMGEFCSPDW